MKRLLVIACWLVGSLTAFAQDDITICHTTPMDKFALMASSKEFKASHLAPKPYKHISQAGGQMITFKGSDGMTANAYQIMAKQKTNNWIFVFQEWWGLNDHIKREAEKFYTDLGNVNVLALDMYDGKVTSERELAGKYMGEFKQERGDAIVKGALTYVGKDAKIATIGWCFGGAQSLIASLTVGKQAVGCIIYYGMPVDNVDALKKLNCDVLGIFATREKWITTDVVKKFEANMAAAGKNLTVKNYDAEHGFANPSNPIFDKNATEDAYANALSFFKARLK